MPVEVSAEMAKKYSKNKGKPVTSPFRRRVDYLLDSPGYSCIKATVGSARRESNIPIRSNEHYGTPW
jgi:hypothetical protein